MKNLLLFLLILSLPLAASAVTIIVDINGGGNFTSIQAGINAATNGDTVKVLPGVYNEQIIIGINIVLCGSGYENTYINSTNNPTVIMNSGKIMWFNISSSYGRGIDFTNGILTNCVIRGCASDGVQVVNNAAGTISNCVVYQNAGIGIYGANNITTSIFNCISWVNSENGYSYLNYPFNLLIVNYSCGSYSGISTYVGNINIDPQFTSSTNYHISPTSPCWNTGKIDVFDPDGSRSDMGYFGGPDCPIFPIVSNIQITPLTTGGVQVQATGVANY